MNGRKPAFSDRPTVLSPGELIFPLYLCYSLTFVLLNLCLVVPAFAVPADSFSVRLDLKFEDAIELREWGRPFSFTMDLLADTNAAILKMESQQFRTVTEMDSSGQTVTIRRVLFDKDWIQPIVFDREQYAQFRLRNDLVSLFRSESQKSLQRATTQAGQEALTIEIPFKIKSKTFNKIFGGDRVRLRISGNINIQGGFRREGRSQVQTTTGQSTSYNFHIDQTQRFKITGEVGDKVTVDVDQNSERTFDFENSIKLTYTGYEDEIIQKIEAGNISMQLTGTQLATFSGQNKGLFGLKSEAKIGALSLTGIASLEKGQKNKLTITGGAQETAVNIPVTQPQTGRYFFLDRTFREQFKVFDSNMQHTYDNERTLIPDSVFVYKSFNLAGGPPPPGLVSGWAIYSLQADTTLDPSYWTNVIVDSLQSDRNHSPGTFQLLDRSEYFVDTQLGYIRLNSPVASDVVLAVAYKTTTNEVYGDLLPPPASDTTETILKLLKPPAPLPYDDTWKLAWRNVYNLGGVNVEKEGFSLRITYSPSGTTELETISYQGQQQTFLTLLGLDTRSESSQTPDGLVDDNPALIKWGYGEIIFPDLRPFDPEGYYISDLQQGIIPAPYSGALPDSLREPTIYDTTAISPSYFSIKASYKSVKAVYELGFNVLEGSEEVYLGGRQLQKGSDYVIDYYSGTLTILNQAALSPSANLEILYESGELFQLDKKTLLGIRGEYHLWDQSFIGATALYLNEKPLQDRVKIGNEPLRNFLWDLNTRLVFKPNFLTAAVDHLPLIETEAPSEFKVEMEYAQVHPNPNSLSSDATGDPNGVAYVDDFESIKKTTPLGIMRRQWTMASDPGTPGDNLDSLRMRGTFVWFNPFDQVKIEDIWPNRPTNSQVAQRTHVLSFYFIPSLPDSTAPVKTSQYSLSWGGVMRALSAGYANQENSKYIEIMLRVGEKGASDYQNSKFDLPGKLYIDMGQISEDVIPNHKLDTEDKYLTGLPYGNGFLDNDEDVGLDGMSGVDPSDFWDINGDSVRNANEPASNDDWYYSPSNPYDVWKINGTEGNRNDEGGRYPDTEDLDKDNFLDEANNYFRYTIDLSEKVVDPFYDELNPGGDWHPGTRFLVSPPNDKHWKLYRIPLDAAVTEGNPDLTQIDYVRVWVDGFEDSLTYEISIATLEVVGNEWQAVPIITPADSSYERVSVEVINTYDNPLYTPPPGVAGYRDPVTDIVSQEQSLQLRINDLPKDSVGMAIRWLYEAQDYLEYRKLKMFVHGGGFTNQEIFEDRDIWMFFRFGADTTRNYYEYRQRVWPGWDERNNVEIDLAQLTSLKLDRPNTTDDHSTLVAGEDSLAIKGNPSISQVRQFTVGIVARDQDVYAIEGLQIWLDELRVSDVKKDIGRAARASADLTLADLASLHGSLEVRDGDFHDVNTRVGTRQNHISGSATGTLQLQKVFDPKWGLAIPVNGNYSEAEDVPYYFPNSDILVDQKDQEQVDTLKTRSRNFGAGVDISKNTPSSNTILKYTVDKLSGGYDFTRNESSNPTTLFSHQTTNSATVGYNLTFGRPSLSFLAWLKGVPVLNKYKDAKLCWLITKLNLSLTGTESITKTRFRAGNFQFGHTFNLVKGLTSGIRPFENLTMDYTRTHKANLLKNPENPKDLADILQGDLGWSEDIDITQNISATYTPQLLSWLDTDTRYNTTYHWMWQQPYAVNNQSISNNNTISASGTLKLTQIFKKPTRQTGGQAEPGSPQQPPGSEEGDGKSSSLQQEGDKGISGPGEMLGEEGVPGDSTRLDTTQVDTTTRELLQIAKPKGRGAISDFWYAVRYTVTRLRDVRVDYTQTNNWSDPLAAGQAGIGYQLGLNSHDFTKLDTTTFSGFSTRTRSDDYKLKSGLDFTKNLKVSLNYNYRWSRNQSNSTNGTIARSRLYFFQTGGDSVGVFEIPFPEYSLTWSGLEKLELFKNVAEAVSLENTLTGSKTSTWNDNESNVTRNEYARNFNPLLGVNITWKKGISSTLRYNWTETGTVVLFPTPSKTRTRGSTAQLTVSYTMKTGFRIPIPVWPFKNKRFKNSTTFAFTFNYSTSHQENEAGGKFIETSYNNTWSVKPSLDYTFSNTVTGGLHFEYGANKSQLSDTNFQEFGLRVNITIRG